MIKRENKVFYHLRARFIPIIRTVVLQIEEKILTPFRRTILVFYVLCI